ncbi:MAG: hypothetical protein HY568_03130, partial [Candidatus Latescibacteria bacterium]|nr:hypothetical protein [Candidatus Latescibacterota bacterium]
MGRPALRPERPPAFVLNMYDTGLAIARNLGRRGIPVVGVSSRDDLPGSFSRYCRPLVGPDSREDPRGLAAHLIDQARRLPARGIIFPTRDADVLFLDAHREALEPHFAIPLPGRDALRSIMEKSRLAALSESAGIAAPRTCRVTSEADILLRRDEFVFPALVKPVLAEHWRRADVWNAVGRKKAIRVERLEDLVGAYRRSARYVAEALVQEWVPGNEDQFFIVGAYVGRDGTCRGAFTAQKLHQYPPDFGLGCLVRSRVDPVVEELGLRLLRAIGFTGIAEVEFKRDARDGAYRLIEVNPRPWDQHALGAACGVDVAYLAYRDHCEPPAPRAASDGRERYWV